MAYSLNPILTTTPGQTPSYSVGLAETFSWVPIQGETLQRPLYARASYITNFEDFAVTLSAENVNIGSVTIKDADTGLQAQVSNTKGGSLQVETQALSSNTDTVTIGDKQNNFATVNSNLSALNVRVANTVLATVDTSQGFPISYADSPNMDAFGRLRVSNPKTLLDAKHLYDKLPLLFNEKLSGTATSTFSANDSMIVMSTTNAGDFAIRQTRYHFNYQPGKSLQALFTGKLHPQTGITKRMGLYQSLSSAPTVPTDGIYLEVTESGPRFCVAKTQGFPHSMVFPQSAWNVDKLNGTGISGATVAMSAAQIFVIDYEWLSLGRVRFGFMQAGKTYYAHYVDHVNELDRPYITSPNQPVRYEIIQTGATAGVMHQICSTVMVEGGEEDIGKPIAVSDSEVTNISTTYKALLAIKLKKDAHDSSTIIKSVEVLNTSSNPGLFSVILNPTYVSTPFSWIDLDNTSIQYSTGGASLSGGYELLKAFIPAGIGGTNTSEGKTIQGEITKVGVTIDGDSDIIVLVARALKSTSQIDAVGVMNLVERS